MSKKSELAKNTAIITVGKIATQFVSFFLLPLYTAALSTSEFGIVELCITYTSLLMPIVLCQVDQGLFRFMVDMRNDEIGKKKILSTVVMFAVIQVCIVSGIFVAIQGFINSVYKWFLFFNVLTMIGSNLMLQTSRGLGDYVGYAGGSFLSAVWQIAGNVLGILVFHKGAYGMLVATITANLAATTFIFVRKKLWLYLNREYFDKNLLREVLKYSIPLIPNALSWWTLHASDRTIVSFILGTSAAGLLSVANKFSNMYITIYQIFNVSWTESAALHINDSDKEHFFTEIINTMFQLFMSMAIGIVACLPFVFPIMVHEKFQSVYPMIPICVVGTMLNVVVGLYSVIYVALKKTKEIARTAIYSAVINIAVHLLFIKWLGLYAAAISTAVSFAAMVLYRYIDLKKYMEIKLKASIVGKVMLLFGVSLFSYYCNNKVIQGILLVVIVAGVAVMNRSFLFSAIQMIKKRSFDIKKMK